MSEDARQLQIDWTARAERRSPAGLDLADDERRVLDVLEGHRGRERAIVSADLARRAGVSERRLRSVLRHLVIAHRVAVGSATGEPAGYYLITSETERRAVRDSLFRRALRVLQRSRAYDRDGVADVLTGQLVMFDEAGGEPGEGEAG